MTAVVRSLFYLDRLILYVDVKKNIKVRKGKNTFSWLVDKHIIQNKISIPWWLVCLLLWSDDWRIVAAGLTVFVALNESTGTNYSSILGLNLTSSALSRSPVILTEQKASQRQLYTAPLARPVIHTNTSHVHRQPTCSNTACTFEALRQTVEFARVSAAGKGGQMSSYAL